MEKFVVSARKYRPATFDTVVGQDHITTTLKNAIRTNHLAQAFLFCGPRGVGKTTCARILAKTINCMALTDDIEPCQTCVSCTNFDQNTSFTIHELDAASNNSVDDIRNLIDQVRFPPQQGKYSVYIIDEVHMLSQAAFNAFLKTLEEPPKHAIFILATTEKHKILPTILSRCQIFDFNRIQLQDIANHLAKIAVKEGVQVEMAALEVIAQKAEGGLRDALSMFDLNVTFAGGQALTRSAVLENLHILDYDYFFKMTQALYEGSTTEVLLLFDEILTKGFDAHQFVIGLNEHFRNVLVAQHPDTRRLLEVTETVRRNYEDQAKLLSTDYILSALSIGQQIDQHLKAAKNQRLHVEIGLLKLAHIRQVLHLADLPVTQEADKKKIELKSDIQSTEPVATEIKDISSSPRRVVSPRALGLKSTLDLENPIQESNPPLQEVPMVQATSPLKNWDLEHLTQALTQFAETRDLETEKVILSRVPSLEGNEVTFMLSNEVQWGVFNEMKQELGAFLRQIFGKTEILLSTEMATQDMVRKPYTAQEKFEALKSKNPVVETLRQDLNLELLF
ncbi:MAG: DNA polymerase III subunit gamma/tau [Spirosomataceae bacterium]